LKSELWRKMPSCATFLVVAAGVDSPVQAAVTTWSGIKFAPEPGHSLSIERERRLEQALRRVTGLNELSFTDDGINFDSRGGARAIISVIGNYAGHWPGAGNIR
jgi:hypothetical protein